MTKSITARQILGTAAVMALGAVCFAVFTQYALDMQPCPWCVLQRLICIAIVLAALPGVLWTQRSVQILSSLFVLIFALAGAAAALWQHFVAAASASCDLTLADRIISGMGLDVALPDVFAPRASCAEAAVTLLSIPYDIWSLVLFLLLGVGGIFALCVRP